MQAEICVDYLSHSWDCQDLIHTYKETRKQRQKYTVENITTTTSLLTQKERKLKRSEQYKLYRFENALWRAMARHCTSQLSQSNQLVDPSTVSWQKESDITWLYGPKYTTPTISEQQQENCLEKDNFTPSTIAASHSLVDEHEDDTIKCHRAQSFSLKRPATTTTTKTTTTSSLQSLKPVLKKQSNVTQILPTYSEPIFSYLDSPQVLLTSSDYQKHFLPSYHSTARSSISSISSTSSSGSETSSIATITSSKPGVHFNPEIIEIEYQPEHPVSLERSPHISARIYHNNCNYSVNEDHYPELEAYSYDYDDDDEDDEDELWSLIADAGASIKSSTTYTRIMFLIEYLFSFHHEPKITAAARHIQAKKECKGQQQQLISSTGSTAPVVPLLVSMMKSLVSLTTTWLLYQSLSPLTWLAKKSTLNGIHHHQRHYNHRSKSSSATTSAVVQ